MYRIPVRSEQNGLLVFDQLEDFVPDQSPGAGVHSSCGLILESEVDIPKILDPTHTTESKMMD